MKLSSNENALGAGEKAREAYAAALKNIHLYPDGRAAKAARRGRRASWSGARAADLRQWLGRGLRPAEPDLSDRRATISSAASTASWPIGFQRPGQPGPGQAGPRARASRPRSTPCWTRSMTGPASSMSPARPIRPAATIPPRKSVACTTACPPMSCWSWTRPMPSSSPSPTGRPASRLARDAANIVVTRTFSKIHGLGGLRIGFGYAPLAVAEAIDRIRLPFNVSVPGLDAATAALGDEAHQTGLARPGPDLASAPDPGHQGLRLRGLPLAPAISFWSASRTASAQPPPPTTI